MPVITAVIIRSHVGTTILTRFCTREDNTLILIAEMDEKPAGYALGRIIQEEATADNGTGKMGLFDELFVDEAARGFQLGQQLTEIVDMDEVEWYKPD